MLTNGYKGCLVFLGWFKQYCIFLIRDWDFCTTWRQHRVIWRGRRQSWGWTVQWILPTGYVFISSDRWHVWLVHLHIITQVSRKYAHFSLNIWYVLLILHHSVCAAICRGICAVFHPFCFDRAICITCELFNDTRVFIGSRVMRLGTGSIGHRCERHFGHCTFRSAAEKTYVLWRAIGQGVAWLFS